jgi:hypothetical protein
MQHGEWTLVIGRGPDGRFVTSRRPFRTLIEVPGEAEGKLCDTPRNPLFSVSFRAS